MATTGRKSACGAGVRPKREGRFKGSRAMAVDEEAGTTDRSGVSCTRLSMRKVAVFWPTCCASGQNGHRMGSGPRLARTLLWLGQRTACWVCSPVRRIAVRCCRQDGTFAYGILICSLSIEQALVMLQRSHSLATDPVAALGAYVNYYDLRGGGIETTFKGDKQGLGLTKRNKKRFEAQYMLVLLGSLAHNVVVWARRWLSCHMLQHYGLLRMVRDVFHVSGMLRFAPSGSVVQIILNQEAGLAHAFLCPLQALLAPFQVVVNLGEILGSLNVK